MKRDVASTTRRREFQLFFFLTVVLFPIIAVGLVASYGFAVWMTQLVLGPPAG